MTGLLSARSWAGRLISCVQVYRRAGILAFRNDHSRFSTAIEQLILRETELSSDHLTPEIKLRLITPNCALWYQRGDTSPFVDPFWAFYWPGGQVLSRYILDNPKEVRGRHVLDVGSGCGASAIACKMAGANSVIANDIDADAAAAIRLNSDANDVVVHVDQRNLIGLGDETENSYDVVILGDVFYDENFANIVVQWLKLLVARNKTVLLGDPGRLPFKSVLSELRLEKAFTAELPGTSSKENYGFVNAYVWKCTGLKT